MDIFKYAYQLYPFVSSELLVESLLVTVVARKIDIRASPYDASQFEGLENPICVETTEGRAIYAAEQEELAKVSVPIRQKLIDVYDKVLQDYTAPISPLRE
jgi:hypothetical protein